MPGDTDPSLQASALGTSSPQLDDPELPPEQRRLAGETLEAYGERLIDPRPPTPQFVRLLSMPELLEWQAGMEEFQVELNERFLRERLQKLEASRKR